VSERLKRDLCRHYREAAADVIVVPNGVDADRFGTRNRVLYREKVRQEHDIPLEAPVLLFIGGDWERKGVPCLIKALSLVRRHDVRLLVVGGGEAETYQCLARDVQIEGRVTFVSHSKEIHRYYAACDILAFPTLYEPFGLVILEAMASGLPVITSRLAGVADYIVDGVSGVLLDNPDDPSELASRIEMLLSNGQLRATMGKHAQEVAESLSWDATARRTLDVYHAAANSRRRR